MSLSVSLSLSLSLSLSAYLSPSPPASLDRLPEYIKRARKYGMDEMSVIVVGCKADKDLYVPPLEGDPPEVKVTRAEAKAFIADRLEQQYGVSPADYFETSSKMGGEGIERACVALADQCMEKNACRRYGVRPEQAAVPQRDRKGGQGCAIQ